VVLFSLFSFFSYTVRRRPSSPLFPYTSLFRSRLPYHQSVPPRRRTAASLRKCHRLDCAGTAGEKLEPGVQPVYPAPRGPRADHRSEEHTSELQSRENLVCRLLLEKKKTSQHRT